MQKHIWAVVLRCLFHLNHFNDLSNYFCLAIFASLKQPRCFHPSLHTNGEAKIRAIAQSSYDGEYPPVDSCEAGAFTTKSFMCADAAGEDDGMNVDGTIRIIREYPPANVLILVFMEKIIMNRSTMRMMATTDTPIVINVLRLMKIPSLPSTSIRGNDWFAVIPPFTHGEPGGNDCCNGDCDGGGKDGAFTAEPLMRGACTATGNDDGSNDSLRADDDD